MGAWNDHNTVTAPSLSASAESDMDLSMSVPTVDPKGTGLSDFLTAGPVDARPGQWWVVLPLWTREEGMSDLSLQATVTESRGGIVVVIDDIRVL
jgi:hypothetical protein